MTSLVADRLVARRGGRDVVDGVSLEVHGGQVVGLVGPSGSGKSTTLLLLAGLEPPDAGVVRLDGEDLAGLDAFLVEARTLATFRHPNIVRVARFFEAHRTAYMVLEYERGKPLRQWWRKRQLAENDLLDLLKPLVDGLAIVHAAGFLHRRGTVAGVVSGQPGAFARLAAAEVGLMAVALGLAVALTRTAT